MAPIHLRVMPSGDVFTWILGISAKNVVSLDLLGFEEMHCLEMLRQMDKAKLCPGRLSFCEQTA
jgi:hypothetical protein